jgi:hypothetical protein
MSLNRFSSRLNRLYDTFLSDRLKGALRYDRIAGYFQSSLLGLAARELKAIVTDHFKPSHSCARQNQPQHG